MKYKTLFCIGSFFAICILQAQQLSSHIYTEAGLSIPVWNFASSNINNQQAGFANLGFSTGINYEKDLKQVHWFDWLYNKPKLKNRYKNKKDYFGLAARINYAYNPSNYTAYTTAINARNTAYSFQYKGSSGWGVLSVCGGAYYKTTYSTKTYFLIKLLLGYASIESQAFRHTRSDGANLALPSFTATNVYGSTNLEFGWLLKRNLTVGFNLELPSVGFYKNNAYTALNGVPNYYFDIRQDLSTINTVLTLGYAIPKK